MLELRNLSRYYKQKKGPTVKALDGINLTINERGMIFVLGKSGSGKSTLLNVIGGLDKYTDGDLLIKGKSTSTFTQSEFDSYRNTMVGFIFQEYNILDEFTVGQNIGIALELQGKKATSEAINEILDVLDMTGYAGRKPNTLSGGQKQRVAIARALVKNPEIIMADEPTGALDSATGKQLFETLKKLSKEKLVIVVTHDHEFAEMYGDRIIEFSDGKIIRDVSKMAGEENALDKEFSPEGITFKAGYQLTDEDVKEINRFLANNRDKTLVKILNDEYSFKDTPPLKSYPDTDKLDLIKSKLPFKSALKMGASALKHKTFRLVLSIILAATAFTMFGVTDTIASFKEKNTALSTMLKVGTETSLVTIQERIKTDYGYRNLQFRISDDNITELNALNDNLHFYPLASNLSVSVAANIGNFQEFSEDRLYNGFGQTSTNALTMTESDLVKTNLKLHVGSLPSNNDEIAVTEYIYSMFKDHGYRYDSITPPITINEYSDLINLKLGDFKITGIVDTKLDLTPYTAIREQAMAYDWNFAQKLQNYFSSSFHNLYFISESYFSNLTSNAPQYINPSSSYFYMTLAEYTTSELMMVESFIPVDSLETDASVIFLDEGKTFSSLAENDVFLSATSLKFLAPDFNTALDETVLNQKAIIKQDPNNDPYIEAYLKDYYYIYGFSGPDAISEYTTWDATTQVLYRTYYADALFNIPLYYENPYQPALFGDGVLKTALRNELPAKLPDLSLKLNQDGKNLNTNTKYHVAGITFDYAEYLTTEYHYYLQNKVYIPAKLAAEFGLKLDGIYQQAIVYHGTNRDAINDLLDTYYKNNPNYEGEYYKVSNHVTSVVEQIAFALEMLRSIFNVIGIIFAVFASLLLINFITLSVTFKKQEIGILRAIGARGFDVSTIFMNEAGIITLINYILAMTATIAISILLNNNFSKQLGIDIVFLVVGARQFIVVLLVAFGVALLSSFIPVYRLIRKKPIDAIRDR